jgi:hypothetical protein
MENKETSISLYNAFEIVSKSLTENDIDIYKATTELKITELSQQDLFEKLKTLIKLVYFNSGFQLKGNTDNERSEYLSMLTQSFIVELMVEYKAFSFADINLAFRRGVLNNYGEYMGLSVVTFMNWLKSYLDERRMVIFNANRILEKHEMENEEKLSLVKTEDKMKLYSIKALKEYKEKGKYYDLGNAIYDFLDKKGMLKITPEEKWEYMTSARLNILDGSREKTKNETNHFKRLEINKYILQVEENKNFDEGGKIRAEAKRIALLDYFDSITELTF